MYKSVSYYLQIFLVSLVILLFYVWQSVQSVKMNYQISRLEKEIQFFKNNNKYLNVRLDELTALSRVERIARRKLGLVSPKENDIIVIFE
jgi:cell division protein FtsL